MRSPSPAHFATSTRSSRFLSAPDAERNSYRVATGILRLIEDNAVYLPVLTEVE